MYIRLDRYLAIETVVIKVILLLKAIWIVELTKSPGSFSLFQIFELSNCLLNFQIVFWAFKLSKALFEFSNIRLNFQKLFELSFELLNFQTYFSNFRFNFKTFFFKVPVLFNLHSTQTKPMCLRKQGWWGVLSKGIWIVVG